jgi:hypothetical protein
MSLPLCPTPANQLGFFQFHLMTIFFGLAHSCFFCCTCFPNKRDIAKQASDEVFAHVK